MRVESDTVTAAFGPASVFTEMMLPLMAVTVPMALPALGAVVDASCATPDLRSKALIKSRRIEIADQDINLGVAVKFPREDGASVLSARPELSIIIRYQDGLLVS